jgi:acyl carrier protein
MSNDVESIKTRLKDFILREFLPGEDPAALADTTPLITGGVLDSIATVQFATFVEEQFGIELRAHELSAEYIDTLASMAQTIKARL